MLNDQRAIVLSTTSSTTEHEEQHHHHHHDHDQDQDHEHIIRDIHALTPPRPPPPPNNRGRRRETWETNSDHRSSSLSTTSSENFSTMSREFNALVLAGSTIGNHGGSDHQNDATLMNNMNNLSRIGEDETTPRDDEEEIEMNRLAIVPDNSQPLDPIASPSRRVVNSGGSSTLGNHRREVSVQSVKKEEVESKINAWQTAKISKLNNRFKREDAIINGCESEEIQKATTWMKKIERKLEEKRARALEKMQNDIAKARRKAEEKRASAEAKRGTKVARVIEIANLMRAVGRAPVKRSFF